jgi:hypothetical protein
MAAFAHSSLSVFAIGTSQMVFNAFLQLMVGAFLMDLARDGKDPAVLQSWANAAKNAGTLAAQLLALVVYAQGGSMAMGNVLSIRQAIAVTAVLPASLVFAIPFLRETRQAGARCSWSMPCCLRLPWHCSVQVNGKSARIAMVVVVVQANLVVIGCKSLMALSSWELAVALSVAASILVGCLAIAWLWYCSRTPMDSEMQLSPEAGEEDQFGWRWTRVALFCFLVNALPSSNIAMSYFQLTVFTPENVQLLGLIASMTSLCASIAFGGCFRSRNMKWTIASIPTAFLFYCSSFLT